MRRALAILALTALIALAAALSGCGGRFPLPTEIKNTVPLDKSYKMQATWTGMTGIRGILLTQGTGTQLFLLFNHGGTGTGQRGEIYSYPRLWNPGNGQTTPPIITTVQPFHTLFNPTALSAGGDGAGSAANRVFVLDQGDTLLARVNPETGIYGDTTGISTTLRLKWRMNQISDLGLFWRVREYGLLGGDTLSTLTDTTLALANGIAVDADGRVYLSGLAIVGAVDPQNPGLVTRASQWRIYRYVRTTDAGTDLFMPGCRWKRDATWVVKEGSGIGTVEDPRNMFWTAAGGGGLYVCDYAKNWVQKLNTSESNAGYFEVDGTTAEDGLAIDGPADVAVDADGFFYLVDAGRQRVLRYDTDGNYIQKVNVELDGENPRRQLQAPIAAGADNTLVFVGDPTLGVVVRYGRRP